MKQRKFFHTFLTFLLFGLVVINSVLFGFLVKQIYVFVARQTGSIKDTSYISGTGSMYPTFPKGKGKSTIEQIEETVDGVKTRTYPGGFELLGTRYFGYDFSYNDIVFFHNEKTTLIINKESSGSASRSTGFVKRIIALPGDTIEFRDGFVYRDGQFLDEPYIASPRSTFGGSFLPDCSKLTIPKNSVFVMGDNRKESNDSRFDVGLIAFMDITHVIPFADQANLQSHYRDTSGDKNAIAHPVLDTDEYLSLLNKKRIEAHTFELVLNEKLVNSALLRAKDMFIHNDFSTDATISGYTMGKAMKQAGYYNIVWGESPILGYYTAQELIDNAFAFPDTMNFLLNPQFDDIGISASISEVNNCPMQLIVQHFGGYVPPNYSNEMKSGWSTLLSELQEILPGWEKITTFESFYQKYQAESDQILSIIRTRITRLSAIVQTLSKNTWLSQQEEQWMNEDELLYKQQESLAKTLNEYLSKE